MEASHRRRAALEQARRAALVVLDRIQALAHRETRAFAPLVTCQAQAAELRRAVGEAGADLHPDVEALVTGGHPFARLITLVQRFAELEDERWEELRDAVAGAFGRSLALAASRGKLALGAVVEPAPAAGLAPAPPRAPAPAGPEVVPVEPAPDPVAEEEASEPFADEGPEEAAAVLPEEEEVAEEPAPAPISLPAPTLSAHVEAAVRAEVDTLAAGGFPATLRAEPPAWLTLPERMREDVPGLAEFARDVRRLGYFHAVVIGVGGAGVVPRVYAGPFPSKLGYPELLILDTVDPATIKRTLDHVDPRHTFFVVCARAEIPAETLALYRLCRDRCGHARPSAGKQFAAITEAGAPLEAFAREQHFRRTFLVPAGLGEPQAAHSWPGLVPAALIGVNLPAFLARAEEMAARCVAPTPAADDGGVTLGAALAALARAGRNKVTFVLSPRVAALGGWLEHLLSAVDAGDGRGLVPIVGESLGSPAAYRRDRVFVAVSVLGETDVEERLSALEVVEQPVCRIVLRDPLDLAGEMLRWQVAAAAAARLLGVSAPGRAEASGRSGQAPRAGRLPVEARPHIQDGGVSLYVDASARPASVAEGLAAHLALAKPGECVTLLAYLPADAETELHAFRTVLRDRLRLATRVGRAPRYLQMVGALQAGAGGGPVIQITSEDRDDLTVPGERATFGGLKRAQILADLDALRESGRPVARLHLDGAPAAGLRRLAEIAQQATART